MLSKILFGVDGSQSAKKALEYASYLASKNNSKLFIVHVIEEFGGLMQVWKQHDSYVNELKRGSKDLLKEYKSIAKKLGIAKTYTMGEEGNTAEKILQVAKDKKNRHNSCWKQRIEYCQRISFR